MLKVGDIVRIKKVSDAMEGSPNDNLEGSIVEITDVINNRNSYTNYHFEFIEKHAKNEHKCDIQDKNLAWEEEHFEPVENYIDLEDIDVSSYIELVKND